MRIRKRRGQKGTWYSVTTSKAERELKIPLKRAEEWLNGVLLKISFDKNLSRIKLRRRTPKWSGIKEIGNTRNNSKFLIIGEPISIQARIIFDAKEQYLQKGKYLKFRILLRIRTEFCWRGLKIRESDYNRLIVVYITSTRLHLSFMWFSKYSSYSWWARVKGKTTGKNDEEKNLSAGKSNSRYTLFAKSMCIKFEIIFFFFSHIPREYLAMTIFNMGYKCFLFLSTASSFRILRDEYNTCIYCMPDLIIACISGKHVSRIRGKHTAQLREVANKYWIINDSPDKKRKSNG